MAPHKRIYKELQQLVRDSSLQNDALLLIDACLVGEEQNSSGKVFPRDLELHEAAQTSARHPGWINTRRALKKLLNASCEEREKKKVQESGRTVLQWDPPSRDERAAKKRKQPPEGGRPTTSTGQAKDSSSPDAGSVKNFTEHWLPSSGKKLKLKMEFIVKGPWKTLLEGYLLKMVVEIQLSEAPYPYHGPTIKLVPFSFSLRQHDLDVRKRLRALYKSAAKVQKRDLDTTADFFAEGADVTSRARFVCDSVGFGPGDLDFSDDFGPYWDFSELKPTEQAYLPEALHTSNDADENVLLEKLGMLHHPNVEKKSGRVCHYADFYSSFTPAMNLKHWVMLMVATLVDPATDPTSNASALTDLLTDRTAYCSKFVGTLEAPGFAFPITALTELRFTRFLHCPVQWLGPVTKTTGDSGGSKRTDENKGSPLMRGGGKEKNWLAKYNDSIRKLRQENIRKCLEHARNAASSSASVATGSTRNDATGMWTSNKPVELPRNYSPSTNTDNCQETIAADPLLATGVAALPRRSSDIIIDAHLNIQHCEEEEPPQGPALQCHDGDNLDTLSNGTVSDCGWEMLEEERLSSYNPSDWDGGDSRVEGALKSKWKQEMQASSSSSATVSKDSAPGTTEGRGVGAASPTARELPMAESPSDSEGPHESAPATPREGDLLFDCSSDFPTYGHEYIIPDTWSLYYNNAGSCPGSSSALVLQPGVAQQRAPSDLGDSAIQVEEEVPTRSDVGGEEPLPAHVVDFIKNGPPPLFFTSVEYRGQGTYGQGSVGTKAFLNALHESIAEHRSLFFKLVSRARGGPGEDPVAAQLVFLTSPQERTPSEQMRWLSKLTNLGTPEESNVLSKEIKKRFPAKLEELRAAELLKREKRLAAEEKEKERWRLAEQLAKQPKPCALVTRDVVVKVKALPEHLFDMEGMNISISVVESVNMETVKWDQLRADLAEDHFYKRFVSDLWLPKEFRHELHTAVPRCGRLSEMNSSAVAPYLYRSMVARHEEKSGGPVLSCALFPMYGKRFYGENDDTDAAASRNDDDDGLNERAGRWREWQDNKGNSKWRSETGRAMGEGQQNDPYGGSGSYGRSLAAIPEAQAPYPIFDRLPPGGVVTPPRHWSHVDKLSSLGEEGFFVHFPMVLFDALVVEPKNVYFRTKARLVMQVDYGFGEPLTGEIDLAAIFSEHVRTGQSQQAQKDVNTISDVLLELDGAEAAEASVAGDALCHLVNFELTFGAERRL